MPAVLGLAAWFGTPTLACDAVGANLAVVFDGPIGSLAFLPLGGRLGVGRPRDINRRLTGGCAFLIASVVFAGANAG